MPTLYRKESHKVSTLYRLDLAIAPYNSCRSLIPPPSFTHASQPKYQSAFLHPTLRWASLFCVKDSKIFCLYPPIINRSIAAFWQTTPRRTTINFYQLHFLNSTEFWPKDIWFSVTFLVYTLVSPRTTIIYSHTSQQSCLNMCLLPSLGSSLITWWARFP